MNLVEVVDRTRVGVDEETAARLVARVLEAEGVDGAELSVTFVGEARIRALNAAHRGRDEVTDVLSFPLEEAGEWDETPEGWDEGPGGPDDAAEGGDVVPPPGAEVAAAGGPPRLLGDVVICARQALRQARADSVPEAFELAVLLAHGTLHLLGWDHEADAGEMALRQAEVLELVEWEGLVAPSR